MISRRWKWPGKQGQKWPPSAIYLQKWPPWQLSDQACHSCLALGPPTLTWCWLDQWRELWEGKTANACIQNARVHTNWDIDSAEGYSEEIASFLGHWHGNLVTRIACNIGCIVHLHVELWTCRLNPVCSLLKQNQWFVHAGSLVYKLKYEPLIRIA